MGIKLGTPKPQGGGFVGILDVSQQATTPKGVDFNGDGTKMFLLGQNKTGPFQFDDLVFQYDLSTAFDVTTASYNNIFKDVSEASAGFQTEFFSPQAIHIPQPGDKLHFAGNSNNVIQWVLSTPFDITTATWDNVDEDIGDVSEIESLTTNPTGTKLFGTDISPPRVIEFTFFGDPFDAGSLGGSTNSVETFSVDPEMQVPVGIAFNTTGTRMFVLDTTPPKVFQYNLGTGFDVLTASFSGKTFDLSGTAFEPRDVKINNADTRIFVTDFQQENVLQYDLPAAGELQ